MNKILYLSGDGIPGKGLGKIYHKHFHNNSKNFFYVKEFRYKKASCDVINFSWWFGQPLTMTRLISLGVPGSVRVNNNVKIIVNAISRIIIYWKLKNNSYDAIIFSDNLYFLNKDLLIYIKKLAPSLIILFSGVSPKSLLPLAHINSIPYFDTIIISDSGLKAEWEHLGGQIVHVLPLSAACPDTFHNILINNTPWNNDIITFFKI